MENLFANTSESQGDIQTWEMYSSKPSHPRQNSRKRTDQGKSQHPPRQKIKRQGQMDSKQTAQVHSGNLKPSQVKQCPENAARERSRVQTLRQAFLSLQAALPSVPPNTKLSKLDVLVLATSYIAHLTKTLDQDQQLPESTQILRGPGYLHPMKKWPMRSRLYAGTLGKNLPGAPTASKE
ncbi:transcription factor 23-like [Rhinatrema bivittatum]|uniref:transcription factor 23-like n=1 Tax=Rhinatrema bivittatum TaxID=194408 RepID=UPI00112DCF11|nr:transcription factor 23-like [Rhinatrema bivittatum]